MAPKILPFFQGALIATQFGKGFNQPNILHEDAELLSKSISSHPHSVDEGTLLPVDCTKKWLSYRRGVSQSNLPSACYEVSLHSDDELWKAIEPIIETAEDKTFMEMYVGSRIAVSTTMSEPTVLQEEHLSQEFRIVCDTYPGLQEIYKEQGLSLDGARILATNELLDRLLKGSLSRLGGGIILGQDKLRFGLLEVYTDPSAATVAANTRPLGPSPGQWGVRQGTYNISATKGTRKAEKPKVDVAAASRTHVDLNLV